MEMFPFCQARRISSTDAATRSAETPSIVFVPSNIASE
jgi:hypothetical protein